MYQRREVALKDLYALAGEPSLNALRERAKAGILLYVRSNGAMQLFDETLSSVRCRASRACKGPGITWKTIKTSVNSQSEELNRAAIEMLNRHVEDKEIILALAALIRARI
jgi:tetrahydromethanopterin S-methyltransferase subunit H